MFWLPFLSIMEHIFPASSCAFQLWSDVRHCEFYLVIYWIIFSFQYYWMLFWDTIKLYRNSLFTVCLAFSFIKWEWNNARSRANNFPPLRQDTFVYSTQILMKLEIFQSGWCEEAPFSVLGECWAKLLLMLSGGSFS